MKMLKLLEMQLLVLSTLIVISCSSSDEPVNPEISLEERTVQVSFGFSGEITSITESPLVRSGEAKNWYAFQVYSSPLNEENYRFYAYGFFDNKEDMIINLKEGYKYKFDVSMVVDGSEKVYCFSLNRAGWAGIGNSFFISPAEWVRYMYEGYLYLRDPYTSFNRPNVDRFFGIATDYVPAQGGTVNINMKRVSFGVKFVAKDFTEGNLEMTVEGAPTLKLSATDGVEAQDIISFNTLLGAYNIEAYSEEIPVNIVWVNVDAARIPVASEKIAFKRNMLTTVEFKVQENTSSSSFNIVASENMETGETIEIGGDGTNTGVNPQ